MDRTAALNVWRKLEEARTTDLEGDPPTYKVRLDADTDAAGDRIYRVRVTPNFGWERDDLLYVLEQANEHEIEADAQNSGIELR